MRGGFLHNDVLIGVLENEIRRLGGRCRREVQVVVQNHLRYIDLAAEVAGRQIALEAELTSKRVRNDIAKAHAFCADELWIVVPNHGVARSVLREVNSTPTTDLRPKISVLTQGQAKQRIRDYFSNFPLSITQKTKENKGRK